MNATLVSSIVCELSYAVTIAIKNDLDQASKRPTHRAYSSYLANWGVEVATDLTVSENSTVNPTGVWVPNSTVFTLSGGVSGGAVATNQNTFNVFYTLADLYRPDVFELSSKLRSCRDPSGNKEGSPLVDIDLHILPLLESRTQLVQLGLASAPIASQKNVLTQTVSIKHTISGEITPKWVWTNSSLNPSGKLFSTGRERTHQIVFTFGPLSGDKQSLSPLAEAFHINEQLKAGLRDWR